VCSASTTYSAKELGRLSDRGRELWLAICGPCRRPYAPTIARHKLDAAWTLRLIRTTHCDLCRLALVGQKRCIEHDHASGAIRGVVCSPCNHLVYRVEFLVPLDRLADYLASGSGSRSAVSR
jgi:hypothetical protein